jgi:nitrite reductase (NO-forming)
MQTKPREQVRAPAVAPSTPRPPSEPPRDNWKEVFLMSLPRYLIALAVVALVGTALYANGTLRPSSASGAPAAATGYRVYKPTGHVVNITLTTTETDQTIVPAAPGMAPVVYHVWTFDGTTPGPVIRVHVGDTVHFTLRNASTMGMQHSIDFHAAMTPWANLPAAGSTTLTGNYQPVNPGQTKTFTWDAMFPGVFMYHCGVVPVLEHISNGMYGAIVVEPNNLPKEREFVLVNSEFYPTPKPVDGVYVGDYDRMLSGHPSYVVWNGVADQYKANPLTVRPNEKFRIWVVNAGPTLTSAFHVIGTMFNSYADGNPANVVYGDQTYNIAPGGAAMFELQIPDSGLYPFVTHAFAYTALGAVGLIKVDPNAPAPPASYPTTGDPFSAGLTAFKPPAAVASVINASSVGGAAATPAPGGTSSTTASCSPHGSVVNVMAQNSAFSTSCLAAPAGKPFTIQFMNMDAGVPHNLSIYTDSAATTALFKGNLVVGSSTASYHVPALKPGTYYFRCDVHPAQMFGTFVVR